MTARLLPAALVALAAVAGCGRADAPVLIRIATMNVEDVRTDDLLRTDHPRLRRIAAAVQRLRPDILLLNEIAYDAEGAPFHVAGESPGLNADRFVANYLSVPQGEGLEPVAYRAFMAPSNTGFSSGRDLNRDGRTVIDWPIPPGAAADGSPAPQTDNGRGFGDDSWGFGTFPGQYGMALLVREGFEILSDSARTFQNLPWASLPDALAPIDPATGRPWYDVEVWSRFPLSSKSHWDVPVRVAPGRVLHVLASHPTPPAFDGDEARNKRRNHDEIRFWNAYLNGASWIRDDRGVPGGLPASASFAILGDLNADPDEGNAWNNPVGTWLLAHPRVNGTFVPRADSAGIAAFPRLDSDDTARWGLRVDYVLPSSNLEPVTGGILREPGEATSDHFPVWIDVILPR